MPRKAKVAASALVLLTAAVLVANSLHRERAAPIAGQSPEAGGHSCPYGEAGCRAAPESSPLLTGLIGEKDFVFVVLPGENRDEVVGGLVGEALAKIATRGVSATATAIEPGADGHAELVASFAIESFPSVVAIGRSHRAAAVSGEITEEKLLRAFEVASTPAPGCGDCESAACPHAQ